MKKLQRIMTNICSQKLVETQDFYIKLFDFDVNFESDWFIHLISKDHQLELGIIQQTHDLVPKAYQNTPSGFYITFVVDNTDDVYQKAKEAHFEIAHEPKDTFYGQRRLLLKDPNGVLVDVSSPIPNFQF